MILKHRTFSRWKKDQYLVRWKGYSPAHNSWVNKEDMNADELLKAFKPQPHSIRTGTLTREWQPLIVLFYSQPMSYNDLPINISTPSPPLSPTVPGAPMRPIHPDLTRLDAGAPDPASTTTTHSPPPFEPLVTGNRKCGSIPHFKLTELGSLCTAIQSYQQQHGTLPEPLQDTRLFHGLNSTTITRYIVTSGAGPDPNIYNYDEWNKVL